MIKDCKSNLAVEFEIKDLGLMHYFLGLEVWQRDGCFFIGQRKYAVEILKRFRMEDCKPMAIPIVSNWRKIDASGSDGFDPTLYRQLIESLMYLANTRLDISFAVNSLSQFMVDPRRVHSTAAKHILRYIKGTVEYGLVYKRRGSVQLAGFTDADWAGCVEDMKSTSSCFNIGLGVVSWFNKKQKSIALRLTEAKYMETSMDACEGMWLRKLFSNLFECGLEATVVHCDNQSGIRLSENPVFHDRSKHIDIRCHFLRDCVQRGTNRLEYIQTDEQVANIFTKALCKHSFVKFKDKWGCYRIPSSLRGSVRKW